MSSIEDFVVVRNVSAGAYGKVVLAKHRIKNDQLYAVKVMEKQHMLNKNMADRINKEKNALAITHSDFVVKIFYALESRSRIYLVMEYMVGGDLKSLLKRYITFPQQVARFYVAECALALEYIHKHGIIHRDIKPDNILIGSNGHIKLTDFGLCNFKRENINVADIIETPLNPARKLLARTPGQVLSLITNFRLTPQVDATYAPSPTFVTAYDSSSPGLSSSIEEEFSTPQSRGDGGSVRYRSCMAETPEIARDQGHEFGATPIFPASKSSGHKRSFEESFGPLSPPSFVQKRHRYEKSVKRLWFTATGESGASSANTTFESDMSSGFELSPVRASTPQDDGDTGKAAKVDEAALNESFGLRKLYDAKSGDTTCSAGKSSFTPGSTTPLTGSYSWAAKGRRKELRHAARRSVRFSSLVPTQTTIEEQDDPEEISGSKNDAKEPKVRLTQSVMSTLPSQAGRLKKKQVCKSQSGIVGTPDYLAPEILREEAHTTAVDVWSLGVCLYEFLVGCPPFIDETVEKVFANILARAIEYPEGEEALSAEAVETIEVLLDPHVIRRPSAVTLRQLPLFQDMEFSNIHNQEAPWVPDSGGEAGNSTRETGDFLSSY